MIIEVFALLWICFSPITSWAAPEAELNEPAPAPQPVLTTTPMGSLPSSLIQAARNNRNLPLADRMDRVSQPLLGKPYVADPLGEGRGYDKDPVVRYDIFDCLTFVEEVRCGVVGSKAPKRPHPLKRPQPRRRKLQIQAPNRSIRRCRIHATPRQR